MPDETPDQTTQLTVVPAATERDLTRIRARVLRKRDPLHGATQIALTAGPTSAQGPQSAMAA